MLQRGEYEGKPGWFDEASSTFFPEGALQAGEYEGKRGLYDPASSMFFEQPEEPKADSGLLGKVGQWFGNEAAPDPSAAKWASAAAKGIEAAPYTVAQMVNAAARQSVEAMREGDTAAEMERGYEVDRPSWGEPVLKNMSDRLGVGVDVWEGLKSHTSLPSTATKGEQRARSIGESLGLSASAVPFGWVAGPALLGRGTGALKYNELREKGFDHDRSTKAALIYEAAETFPEMLDFKIGLSKKIPFVKKLILESVSNTLGEDVTSATQLGADLWAENPGMSKREIAKKYADQIGDVIQETTIQSLIQGPIQAGGIHVASKLAAPAPPPSLEDQALPYRPNRVGQRVYDKPYAASNDPSFREEWVEGLAPSETAEIAGESFDRQQAEADKARQEAEDRKQGKALRFNYRRGIVQQKITEQKQENAKFSQTLLPGDQYQHREGEPPLTVVDVQGEEYIKFKAPDGNETSILRGDIRREGKLSSAAVQPEEQGPTAAPSELAWKDFKALDARGRPLKHKTTGLTTAEREMAWSMANAIASSSHETMVNSEGYRMRATVSNIGMAAPWFSNSWGTKDSVVESLRRIAAGQVGGLDLDTWKRRIQDVAYEKWMTERGSVPTRDLHEGDVVIKPRKSDDRLDRFVVSKHEGGKVTLKDGETETVSDAPGVEMDVLDLERRSAPLVPWDEGYDEWYKKTYGEEGGEQVAEARAEYPGKPAAQPAKSEAPAAPPRPWYENRTSNDEEVAELMSRISDQPVTADDVKEQNRREREARKPGSPWYDPSGGGGITEDLLSKPDPDVYVHAFDPKRKEWNRIKTSMGMAKAYAQDLKNAGAEQVHISKSSEPTTSELLALTPPAEKLKKSKPSQPGLPLGQVRGEDLRAPEREGKAAAMEETPLGKAAKEARDREKQGGLAFEGQQEAYAFPGLSRQSIGKAEDALGRHMRQFFSWFGRNLPPSLKEGVEFMIGTRTGTTDRHPARRPVYEANIARHDNNNLDGHFVLSPETLTGPQGELFKDAGYRGIEPIRKLGRSERKVMDRIRVELDRLDQESDPKDRHIATPDELAALGANDKVKAAYYAERQLFNRLVALVAYKTEKIGLAPYQEEEFFDSLVNHWQDIRDGKVPGANINRPLYERQQETWRQKTQDRSIPERVRMAIRTMKPVIDKINYYLSLPTANPNYFPRVRKQDDWQIRVTKPGPDGKPVEVLMVTAKTEGGANRLKDQIEKNPGKFISERSYKAGDALTVKVDKSKALHESIYADLGSSAARIALFDRTIEKMMAEGEIAADKAIEMSKAAVETVGEILAVRGAGRSFVGRAENLIEGYQTEGLNEVLMSHVRGIIGWLNKAEFAVAGAKTIDRMTDRDDKRWAHQYLKDSLQNMTGVDQAIGAGRAAATLWMLGGVASTVTVNSFDQVMRGIPVFSRYTRNPAAQIGRATKDLATRNLTKDEARLMEQLLEEGETRAQFMKNISGTEDLAPGKFTWVVDFSMKAFGAIEANVNRKPAALAALRLFTGATDKKGKPYGTQRSGAPYSMSEDEALAETRRFLRSAHGFYGRANLPEVVQRLKLLKIPYTFMSYGAEYLNTAWTAAVNGEPQILWRMFVAVAILGGAKAFPGADAWDELAGKVFGIPLWHRLRIKIREALGKAPDEHGGKVEDIIMGGIPELMGVNLSRSIGINLPFTGPGSMGEKALGVFSGMARKGTGAINAAIEGDYKRALESASPRAINNIFRAYRGYVEGVTTQAGYPVMNEEGEPYKFTKREAYGAAGGFGSSKLNRVMESSAETRWIADFWKQKADALKRQYRQAKTPEREEEVMQKIDKFNDALKESEIWGMGVVDEITPYTLINEDLNMSGTPATVGRGGVRTDRGEIKKRGFMQDWMGRSPERSQ